MKKLVVIVICLLIAPLIGEAQGPLVGDAFERPGTLGGDNSQYAIGPTSVGVVLVESDGTIDEETENWTQAEKDAVTAEIEDGLTWWEAREPRANLSFVAEYTQVHTSYEPINRPHSDAHLWVSEVLTAMGYTGTDLFTYAGDYNNDLRNRHGTDWAFTIFVVDSSNDADGKFACGRFAYAYLGGPFLVMTYDNANNGIPNMDRVTAHEVGHIFWALDQLTSNSSCEAASGYLDIPNHNSSNCPWTTFNSIMKFPPAAYPFGLVDRYARGQMGWWDANCNDILDPVDEDLEIDHCFYAYFPTIMKGY